MIAYTIEELHHLFKTDQVDVKEYYNCLYQEAYFQQKRLNAFVTITKKCGDDLSHINYKNILSGIPFVLKDNFHTKNIKTTASSCMLKDYFPIYNACVFEKLLQNGGCLIGKASMDELAMGSTNKTALSGPVYNPWDTTRIAGGSSGGCAALVGSGVIPFALGTDTGDSIRKPAGFCGVVGFKPTWGRVSRYGVISYASSLDTVGVITRNVRDVAIVMEKIAGRDNRDMTSSMKEVPHYLENLDVNIKGIKIAVFKTVSDEIDNSQIKDNFDKMVQKLKDLGANVEYVTFPMNLMKAIRPTYTIIANAEATGHLACFDGIKYGLHESGETIEDMVINSRTKGFSESIKHRLILGHLALESKNQEKMFKKAKKVRRVIVDELNHIYQDYDIVMSPNSSMIAPKVHDIDMNMNYDNMIDDYLILANFAGTPALTLPCGFVEHMPIAVHLMGRLFEEQTVLNVAYALESVLQYKNQYKREG